MLLIKAKTIPEAILQLERINAKEKNKTLKDILITISSPDIYPLFPLKAEEKTRKIILKYYRKIMKDKHFSNEISKAIRKLKESQEAKLKLNQLFKTENKNIILKIKKQGNKMHSTLYYSICRSIDELNEQIAFTQILQEDLSIGLPFEVGTLEIKIKVMHINN